MKRKKKQDDIARVKDSCKVTGRIGMEDLKVSFTADYDKDEYGMKELSAGVSGRQVFSAGLDMSISGEVSGKTTEADVLGFIKLQGLKKKVFPIAYFDCTSGVPVSISGIGNTLNKNIENKNTYMPFSCGFMVYIDIYGNLSLDVKMNYSYADTFENNLILVRDNKIVGSFENSANEPEINYYAGIKASADADVHIGTSALLYLFNINIVDVGIAKAGGEILGTGSLEASSNEEKNSGVNASFYARLYVKILDVKAAIKAQANLWKLSLSAGFDWAETMLDLTSRRDSLNVVFDQTGSPTYAADLASAIVHIIDKGLLDRCGIYHYSNEGVCSWYDFAVAIRDLSGNGPGTATGHCCRISSALALCHPERSEGSEAEPVSCHPASTLCHPERSEGSEI